MPFWKISRLILTIREWGIKETLERNFCIATERMLSHGFRRLDNPSLQALYELAELASIDPIAVLRTLFSFDVGELEGFAAEYNLLTVALNKRYNDLQVQSPRTWAFGTHSSLVLYVIIRKMRPMTVVETGVANGHSSYFILSALGRNSPTGVLHSFDVTTEVGCLVPADQKNHWKLHLLTSPMLQKGFFTIINRLPSVDVMIHDSDHSYRWLSFELELGLRCLSKSGLFVCDDADSNFAMIDFCRQRGLKPSLLIESTKVLGVIRFAKQTRS